MTETRHDDDDDPVSLREAARRLGIVNLSPYFAKYGSRPPYDSRTGDGARVWRMGTVRDWYEATVKNPRHDTPPRS